MVYVTTEPEDKMPITMPENYNSDGYESLVRLIEVQ